MKFINIGYSNSVNTSKIIAVNNVKSRAVTRKIKEAKTKELIIDSTEGKRTNAAIFLEDGYIILSVYKAETLLKKINE